MNVDPIFLLQNSELVTPFAPWCVPLDNLELGILLLSQPGLAGEGLRRAELEHQLTRLSAGLPLGPIYFQRVKRAVARLERVGALGAHGEGRSRRFVVEPEGFAALILNLRVLQRDPTLDGSEFELKRALVSMWNLLLERFSELPEEIALPEETENFFDRVEALTVFGQKIIDTAMVTSALDVLQLIEVQRGKVGDFLASSRQGLEQAKARAGKLEGLDLSLLGPEGNSAATSLLADVPGALAMVRGMASGVLPRMSLSATVLRYEHYLRYLDGLAALYNAELKTVSMAAVRLFLVRRQG